MSGKIKRNLERLPDEVIVTHWQGDLYRVRLSNGNNSICLLEFKKHYSYREIKEIFFEKWLQFQKGSFQMRGLPVNRQWQLNLNMNNAKRLLKNGIWKMERESRKRMPSQSYLVLTEKGEKEYNRYLKERLKKKE